MTKLIRITLFALGLVIASSLAGCLFTSSSSSPFVITDAGVECTARPRISCGKISIDSDSIIIEGADVVSRSYHPAMFISASKTVTLRNVSVEAATTGVQWHLESACPKCKLIIENSTILASLYGIDQRGAMGGVQIMDSHLAVESAMVWAVAVSVDDVRSLAITNVILTSQLTGNTTAISIGDWLKEPPHVPAVLDWQSVRMEGFQYGVRGYAESIGPGPIEILCRETGIYVVGPRLEVENVSIAGCDGMGIDAGHPREINLRQFSVEGSGIGVHMVNADQFTLEDFRLVDNTIGLEVVPGGVDRVFNIANGCVTNNGQVGANIANPQSLSIRNVLFAGNGHDDTPAGPVDGRTTHGGLILDMFDPYLSATWQVVDSSFVDNRPFAIFHSELTPVLDARSNWWGSPEGPNLMPYPYLDMVAVGLGEQTVGGPTIVVPHLEVDPILCP